LLGAIAVIAGLYVVLWGKAGDAKMGPQEPEQHPDDLEKTSARSDSMADVGSGIAEPLLDNAKIGYEPLQPNKD